MYFVVFYVSFIDVVYSDVLLYYDRRPGSEIDISRITSKLVFFTICLFEMMLYIPVNS